MTRAGALDFAGGSIPAYRPTHMVTPNNLAKATFGPLVYLLACAALAAFCAYPVFALSGSDSINFFRKLVSQGGQVFLFLGLVVLAGRLGLNAASLGMSRLFPRQWLVGFALGVLMLGLHVLGLLALDVRVVKEGGLPGAEALANILGKALATGIGVALLEELLFRGALFATARKLAGPAAAVVISAFYYAMLHFVGARWAPELSGLGWDSGFRVAADAFANVRLASLDTFLALFLAGVLLATIRTAFPRGLGLCMGLHAGWVFVVKVTKPLTQADPEARWSYLVGSYDGIVGYLSASWLAVLIVLWLAALRQASTATNGDAR
jgi:membrane protease YdiL (CAAX protease family)